MIRPSGSVQLDYEGELAVVIGSRARRVSRAAALDYVAGYACFNDGSVRDYQRHSQQFTPGQELSRERLVRALARHDRRGARSARACACAHG